MTVSDVKESMKNTGRHVSMDAPLVEGEIPTYMMSFEVGNRQTLTVSCCTSHCEQKSAVLLKP